MRVRKVDKMAQEQRKYEKEYKVQAVKLAKEIGAGKAAKELGIPVDKSDLSYKIFFTLLLQAL